MIHPPTQDPPLHFPCRGSLSIGRVNVPKRRTLFKRYPCSSSPAGPCCAMQNTSVVDMVLRWPALLTLYHRSHIGAAYLRSSERSRMLPLDSNPRNDAAHLCDPRVNARKPVQVKYVSRLAGARQGYIAHCQPWCRESGAMLGPICGRSSASRAEQQVGGFQRIPR